MRTAHKPSQVSPSRRRRWRHHPTVRFLTVVFVLWGLYWSYGYLSGPTRRTNRLNATLALNPATVNLLVTTTFAPEEFHIQLYQKLGSMRGVNGQTAKLYGVSPSHTRQLSRYYWITQIDLAPDGPSS